MSTHLNTLWRHHHEKSTAILAMATKDGPFRLLETGTEIENPRFSSKPFSESCMRRLGLVLCTFISLAVFAARPATAQSVTLSGEGVFTGPSALFPGFSNGTVSFLFTIPMSPVPTLAPNPNVWNLDDAPVHFAQGVESVDLLGQLQFYSSDWWGGFAFIAYDVNHTWVIETSSYGTQLWSGTTAAPTMLLGHYPSFIGTGANNPPLDVTELDITSTVPEPATLTLLATGLVGLAASRRKRFGAGGRDPR